MPQNSTLRPGAITSSTDWLGVCSVMATARSTCPVVAGEGDIGSTLGARSVEWRGWHDGESAGRQGGCGPDPGRVDGGDREAGGARAAARPGGGAGRGRRGLAHLCGGQAADRGALGDRLAAGQPAGERDRGGRAWGGRGAER